SRRLQHGGAADGVREDDLAAIVVEPPVARPGPRQGTVAIAVAAHQARVHKAAVLGVGPAGADGIGEAHAAGRARMDLVLAVEVDAAPVAEAVAAPRCRDP